MHMSPIKLLIKNFRKKKKLAVMQHHHQQQQQQQMISLLQGLHYPIIAHSSGIMIDTTSVFTGMNGPIEPKSLPYQHSYLTIPSILQTL